MSFITGIATAVPDNRYKQSELAEFMSGLFQYSKERKKWLHNLYSRSGIDTRYSVVPDYDSMMGERVFFPKTRDLEPFPSLEQRMRYFNKMAPELSLKALKTCIKDKIDIKDITHLITVSCTGLSAPGLDVELVHRLKLREDIYRTSVNFMGCYAAIHALKHADMICKSHPDAVVLVVTVELCSIHFQKTDTAENITANLLFGDGAGALLVTSEKSVSKQGGFKIHAFHSQLHLNGKKDMAWELSSNGFLMTLSSYIPQLIEGGIKSLFDKAIKQHKIDHKDIAHWAVHPGGRKVLEVVQNELNIADKGIESSYKVLKNYGNMSSSTLLFVLKDILEHKTKKNDKTFCIAFGPGLTMESVLLEYV